MILKSYVYALSLVAILPFSSVSAASDSGACTDTTEKKQLCEFEDSVSAYHVGEGLFVTSASQGDVKIGVTKFIRDANDEVDGRNNIDAMAAHEESYPAFEICQSMGNGWYLPAAREIRSAFMNVPRRTEELTDKRFLTSTFIQDGFGTQSVTALDTRSRHFFPVLNSDGLIVNDMDYQVACVKKL